MATLTIHPKDISVGRMHGYLLGAVAPRPIAFATTVDKQGQVNLSPFSFFNVFSANPPILIFSPARRGRDNTTKHTYENVKEVGEVAISIVNYSMVQQMSLSSTEYPKGVNEYVKAGFTEEASTHIAPPYVKEAPVSFECNVLEVKALGNEGGAGNLVICEVLAMHIDEAILDEDGMIDTQRLDAVARMGGNFYCRAHGEALFEVPKPLTTLGIGVDQLPESVKNSKVLTGNDLGMLANVEQLPSQEDAIGYCRDNAYVKQSVEEAHQVAKGLLAAGDVDNAWKVLVCHR